MMPSGYKLLWVFNIYKDKTEIKFIEIESFSAMFDCW